MAGTTIKIDRKKVESELSDLRKQRDRVSGTIDLGTLPSPNVSQRGG